MSRLETAQGVDIRHQYHGKEASIFDKMMLKTFVGEGPLKRSYYELVNKKGKVVQIVVTEDEYIVQSAAHRMGLDFRLVEFVVTYEDLDKEEDKKNE